jgi:predicted nucleic acid-binding protein
MRLVFADSSYWIALLNPRDGLHFKAKSLSNSLGGSRVVTSEMVFTELLNDYSDRGKALRRAAISLIERLRRNPNVSIVSQAPQQFEEALSLYAARSDKSWSHTDCASFRIMDRDGITQALTYDRHYLQAGFQALLRDQS